jgi:hypothetical protein
LIYHRQKVATDPEYRKSFSKAPTLWRAGTRAQIWARADFFNVFNHPNFGNPVNFMTSPQFGQATKTLAAFLGSGGQGGGLNPLYQIGGPRSIQLALKLQF